MQQVVRSIQIVGKNSLLNALLAAFLIDSTDAECGWCATLEEALGDKRIGAQTRIMLIDCFAMPKDDILLMLESSGILLSSMPPRYSLMSRQEQKERERIPQCSRSSPTRRW